MSILQNIGIVVGSDNKAEKIFSELYPNFFEVEYDRPSEYIVKYWESYKSKTISNNNQNGKIFEYILATLFIREGLLPFYLNAKVTFIPNVIYDIMFYALDRGPICISAKTSLRERYKQADLEAIVLKNVHRRALCFLITLEEEEAKSIKRKIDAHEVIGIDEVIVATEPQFDSFIFRLKGMTLIEPQPFEVIQSNQLISKDKIEKK